MSQHGIVWDKLCTMSGAEVLPLLLDAEQLDKTGCLPLDAPLRKFTEQFYEGNSTVLQMISVAYNVYKIVAMTYYNSLIARDMNEHLHRSPLFSDRGNL